MNQGCEGILASRWLKDFKLSISFLPSLGAVISVSFIVSITQCKKNNQSKKFFNCGCFFTERLSISVY